MSMLQKASRKKVKIKLQIGGAAGSGKTAGALLLAHGLCGDWEKICVIDTENESASLYADSAHLGIGQFYTIPLSDFSSASYLKAIDAAVKGGMEVIIIDSITHLWDWTTDYVNRLGGRFQDWALGKKEFNKVKNAMLQAPVHVISSVRKKEEFAIEENDKGKKEVVKKGLGEQQQSGLSYEFTVVFDVDYTHMTTSSKDRTALFADKNPFTISSETGKMIKDWCESGKADERLTRLGEIVPEIDAVETVEELTKLWGKYPEMQSLPDFKDAFTSKKIDLEKK